MMDQIIADEILEKIKALDNKYLISDIDKDTFSRQKLKLIMEYENYPEEMKYAIKEYTACFLYGIGSTYCPNSKLSCSDCKAIYMYDFVLNYINCPEK